MNLFSAERFVITTYLDNAEIHRRLESVIEPYGFRLLLPGHKPYKGRVSDREFRAERILLTRGRAPLIVGHLRPDGEITTIDVTIKQQVSTLVRIGIGFVFAIGLTLYLLVGAFIPSIDIGITESWLVVLILLIWIAMPIIVRLYNWETIRTKRFFQDLLEDGKDRDGRLV